jgi:alkanesulfonate monooxygenase SsuD/methylene tetrahydromethanopterin reductase-like flavin-dependent oxidoreductase (luciferase family)
MKVGVIFPQTECGTDVEAIGEFARGVEAMGFDHLFVADHVLGADPKFHYHPSLATLMTGVRSCNTTVGIRRAYRHTDNLRSPRANARLTVE